MTLCEMTGYERFTTGAANVDDCYLKVWAMLLDVVHEQLAQNNQEHKGLQLVDGDDPQRMVAPGYSRGQLTSIPF